MFYDKRKKALLKIQILNYIHAAVFRSEVC